MRLEWKGEKEGGREDEEVRHGKEEVRVGHSGRGERWDVKGWMKERES